MKIKIANDELYEGKNRLSWRQEELNRLVNRSKELDRVKDEIDELRRYLESEKFWQDTTVQVNDVLRRLPVIYKDV